MEQIRYEESGIDQKILRGIKEMGFEVMTPIQAQAIPVFLEGKDIIGQAQTGTGKTAAFGIPIIQNIDVSDKHLQALILCPTRELAIQAADEMRKFAKFTHGIKILPIYGGQDIGTQIRSLKGGVQIIVGTPGRIMDHMKRHTIKLKHLKTIVLDEADEMLNMGFREDIETILSDIPAEHQTALFSATMPKAILDITSEYQKPDAVMVKVASKELTVPLIKQYYYEVKKENKIEVVCRLLDYYIPKKTLIFCNTKKMVDILAENLKGRGYLAEGLHGDMSQHQRDVVMKRFKADRADILIATDVAARGIDVDDVEAVINYDIPQDIEYYVHRIGRTGRAGKKGRSFTLVVGKEIYKIRDIEKACKTKVKARTVPSGNDVTATKAQRILTEVLDIMHNKNLNKSIKIIEQQINDEDCTALELAAAFLKREMGAEPVDIPTEDYFAERKKRKLNENKNSGKKNNAKSNNKLNIKSYSKSNNKSYDDSYRKNSKNTKNSKHNEGHSSYKVRKGGKNKK